MFASFAAIGFLAAYAGPVGMALAESAPVSETTSYAAAIGDPQSLVVASSDAGTGLTRSSYDVYVTPKPTPTPTAVAAESSSSSSSSASSARPMYTGGGSPAEWMSAAGIAESDWGYVDYIVSHESGWNPNATNSGSGACGLVQALPCSKVSGNGYDPVDNLRWGTGYAVGRYGSWADAYNFWTANHWW